MLPGQYALGRHCVDLLLFSCSNPFKMFVFQLASFLCFPIPFVVINSKSQPLLQTERPRLIYCFVTFSREDAVEYINLTNKPNYERRAKKPQRRSRHICSDASLLNSYKRQLSPEAPDPQKSAAWFSPSPSLSGGFCEERKGRVLPGEEAGPGREEGPLRGGGASVFFLLCLVFFLGRLPGLRRGALTSTRVA